RRTILWVIFGFSLLLLWDQWQVAHGHKPLLGAPPPATVATPPVAAPAGPRAEGTALPGAAVPALATAPAVASATRAPGAERFEVSTDVLKLTFDTEGGSVVGAQFLRYGDTMDANKPMVLLDDSASRVYVAQSGLVAGATPGEFPTHKTVMKASGDYTLKDGQDTLTLTFTSEPVGGVQLTKTYTIARGSYALQVQHTLTNTSAAPVSAQLYLQLVRDGNKLPGESSFYSTFTGPAVYTDAKKYQKVEFSAIKKKGADYEKESQNGYIAMVQHYFASAWVLPAGMQRSISLDGVDIGSALADCCYRAAMVAPLEALAPGASKTVTTTLFIGPQEEKMLEALTPGLELVKDYGWLTILAKPLYWLLDALHRVLQNWGWA
ncbi:MAG: membrane protein insertase YidC, partial [Betaproteobacteria bacterium]|nr:membrane protein insertase YidC [Betaproteobacteria bacterium]